MFKDSRTDNELKGSNHRIWTETRGYFTMGNMNKILGLLLVFLGANCAYAQVPDYANNPSFWVNGNITTPIPNTTPVPLITAAPTPTGTPASQAYYITDFTATNSSTTVPTDVQLLEGSTVRYQCGAAINSVPCTKTQDTPIRFSPNTTVSCRSVTAGAAVRCSVQGYRSPF